MPDYRSLSKSIKQCICVICYLPQVIVQPALNKFLFCTSDEPRIGVQPRYSDQQPSPLSNIFAFFVIRVAATFPVDASVLEYSRFFRVLASNKSDSRHFLRRSTVHEAS